MLAAACSNDGAPAVDATSGSTGATGSTSGGRPTTTAAIETTSSTSSTSSDNSTSSGVDASSDSGSSSSSTTTGTTDGGSTTTGDGSSSSGGDESPACVLPDESSDGGDEGVPLDLGVDGGCGNAIVEDGEVCDDGNAIGGDGCENDCTSSDDVLPEFSLTMGGPFNYPDCGSGVAFDSQNNLILGGYISDDIWIRKYDVNYEELWTVIYDGHPGAGCYVPLAVDSNDNIAFAGPAGAEPNADWLFGLLDPDGMELWTDTLDGPVSESEYPRKIAVDSQDAIIVVGNRVVLGDAGEAVVLKYTNDGLLLWSEFLSGGNHDANFALAVDTDDCDNIAVSGGQYADGTGLDMTIRKYDADGGLIWAQDEITPLTDWALGVGIDFWGRVVVAGLEIDPMGNDADFWLRQYDSDGNEQWTQFEDGGGSMYDAHHAVVVSQDGSIWTAGKTTPSEFSDLAIVRRISAIGQPTYSRSVNLGPMDAWLAIARAPDGRIAAGGVFNLPPPNDSEAAFAVFPP
jgi:cysteine-rich repeat protein